MTKREFFNAVIEANISEEMNAQAIHELELLDKKNANRSNTPSKRQVENEGIKANLITLMSAEPQMAKELTVAYNEEYGTELNVSKIASLLTQLVKNGSVIRTVEKRNSYYTLVQ